MSDPMVSVMSMEPETEVWSELLESSARFFSERIERVEARCARIESEIVRLKERLAIERAVKVRREMEGRSE